MGWPAESAAGRLACRKRRCRTPSFRRQNPRILPACLNALIGWPAERAAGAFGLSTKYRGFDLPLHLMLRGRGAIHRHGSHAARAGAMGHEPGVERARLARGEPEQQVEFALRESLLPVDALIGHHELALVGGRLGT